MACIEAEDWGDPRILVVASDGDVELEIQVGRGAAMSYTMMWLSPDKCREIAAVLLETANKAEQS